MKAKTGARIFVFILILAVLFVPTPSAFAEYGGRGVEGEDEGHETGYAGPLIEEMWVLDGAFRQIVSAVALGDGAMVVESIEPMHGMMEKTHEAVGEGTVTIPKNAERVEEFVEMDKKFHADLERLAHAAHEDNQEEMLALTKRLLDGCVRCHRTFRE